MAASIWTGNPIDNMPPHKRNIGMVFQNYALFPHMTVEENLAFPLEVRKIPKAEQRGQDQARPRDGEAGAHSASAARASFPAASSSASRSPARWCSSRSWC